MAEHCVCGNVLRDLPYTVRISPCRCVEPGAGPSHLNVNWPVPEGMTETHYNERKRTGLPLITPLEHIQFRHKMEH